MRSIEAIFKPVKRAVLTSLGMWTDFDIQNIFMAYNLGNLMGDLNFTISLVIQSSRATLLLPCIISVQAA